MNNFFNDNILDKIKNNETEPEKVNNFFEKEYCSELLDFRKLVSRKMVDREESTKIPFKFDDSEITKNLKNKILNKVGDFSVKDFEPHFITTRYPLRIHADTGKDPNDIIFKNIVIPLEINRDNSNNLKTSHTIVFKNSWYYESALFTTKTDNNYDFIIKDIDEKFIDIIDIFDFKKKIDEVKNNIIEYENSRFFVDDKFKKYIDSLSKTKRYNLRTDKHIINKINFNIDLYNKYMSHQPYEDCMGLIFDKALSWEVGSLLIWDRIRIHASDNFLKNGIISKTCIALFTSK